MTGDLALLCVSFILQQANTDMFSWLWQSTRPSGNPGIFQVSAGITFVNIPLARAGHEAELQVGVG